MAMNQNQPTSSMISHHGFMRSTTNTPHSSNIRSSTAYSSSSSSSSATLQSEIDNYTCNKNKAKSRRSWTFSSSSAAKRYLQQIVSSHSSTGLDGISEPKKVSEPPAATPANLTTSSVSPNQQPQPKRTQPLQPGSVSSQRPPLNPRARRPISIAAMSQIAIGGGNSGIPSHANSLQTNSTQTINPSSSSFARTGSDSPLSAMNRTRSGSVGSLPLTKEKPVASASGGAMSVSISLAEPVLFLQGFEPHNNNGSTPALLRGSLVLRLTKSAKIKSIALTFKGRARTEWPEGIPPRKSDFFEELDLMTHTWPFFNAQFPTAELGHGADSARIYGNGKDKDTEYQGSTGVGAIGSLARSSSPIALSTAGTSLSERRYSLQQTQSKSFTKSDYQREPSIAQRGYRNFQPGDYIYNFELPLESVLPESILCDLGSVRYELEATIERAGAFRPNLVGRKEVTVVRCPAEASLEQVEPIAISRNWEDQLHYDIIISGKSFPLGAQIPIAFKLTPLAKVRCHRIKIFVTENVEYYCRNKKVHRIEPTRKIQLFEKRADGPVTASYPGSSARVIRGGPQPNQAGSGNMNDSLLGDLQGDRVGPTELEFTVQLPGCGSKEKDRIHFDTTYPNIQVHHWIKIVMRLSKTDPNDPTKRRHFEISIDSPFHILSCKCSQANTSLPAYNDDRPTPAQTTIGSCACPPLTRRNSPRMDEIVLDDIPMPLGNPRIENSGARPMHLLRAPSFNPPAFEDDVAPPALMTPPPKYDSMFANNGLADYFARLADELHDDDTDDDHLGRPPRLPLTPGGRIARSMDERRTWDPIGRTM